MHCKRFYHVYSKKTVSKFLGKISALCSCPTNTTIRITEVVRIILLTSKLVIQRAFNHR
jgi:hypothetical protein